MSEGLDGTGAVMPVKEGSAEVGKRVAKATGAIAFGQMAAKFLGAIEKPLMAARFGTGAAADAFGAAVGLVLSVSLFVEQLAQHSFMPTFIQTRTREGEKQGWRLVSVVANLVLLAFAAIGVLVFFFAPQVVRLTTNFPNQQATSITVHLLRVMVPALIILPVSSLTYVILNSYKLFGLPAAADVAFKGGTVVALLFMAAQMGIPAMALGVVLGAVVKLALHLLGLRARLPLYRPVVDLSRKDVRTVGVLAVPLLFGSVLALFRPLWDNWLASGLAAGGAVAALRYGRALVDTPAQIFPLALRRALFPFMSEMAARNERERMTEMVVRSLRVVAFVFVPMTVAMLLLRYPIVEAVYQWGKFGKESTELVVPVVTCLALGLLAMGAEMILLEPYFAMSDTLTPTKIAVVTFVIHIGFTAAAVFALGWGVGGIALGYTVARTTKVLLLGWGLRDRLARVDFRPIGVFAVRLSLAVAAMAGVMWLVLARPVLPRAALLLQRQQLKDKSRLLTTLANPADPRAPLSAYLVAHFSPETRQALGEFHRAIDPPAALKRALADDLNRTLAAAPLYDDERFANVELDDATWKLVASRPAGVALARLNRSLLEQAYPHRIPPVREVNASTVAAYQLRPEDFDYGARFVMTLREAKDPVSAYLKARLSPETRAQIERYQASYEPDRALRQAVVDDLNRLLQGECLYDRERFAAIPISRETAKLVERRPEGTIGLWLNRLLLEEAYRDEIAPPSKAVDFVRLSVPSAAGLLVFVILCLALRVDEAAILFGAVTKRLRRRR